MLERWLRWVARLACRRAIAVAAAGVFSALLCGLYAATSLQLNADTDDLIGADRPYKEKYDAFLSEFGDLEYLYVVVADNGHTRRAEECVEFIAQRLTPIEGLPGVFWSISPREQLILASRAMSDEEAAALDALSDGIVPLLLKRNAAEVMAEATDLLNRVMREGALMPAAQRERLGAAAVWLARLITSPGAWGPPAQPLHPGDGLTPQYLTSDSGELHFILIMPVKDYGTMAVIAEPVRRIRAVLDEARAAFPDLDLGLTGKPVLQADEMATTGRDMMRASLMAVALVAILFITVIGGVWRSLLAIVALGVGIAWTFGLTTLVVGQLNLLSIVFTLVLVGIGIDFGVHLIARYKEFLRTESVESAVEHAVGTTGRGNLTAAITSSAAFLMSLFTEFQGLRELGFIAGSGLLLCLMSMTVMLPALLVIYERHWGKGRPAATLVDAIPAAGGRVWRVITTRPGWVLSVCAALTLALLPFATRVRFDGNLLDLQAQGLESVEWEHRILDDSAETWFAAVMVDALDEARDVAQRAAQSAAIGRVGTVLDVVSRVEPVRFGWTARFEEHGVQGQRSSPLNPPSIFNEPDVRLIAAASVRLDEAIERLGALTATAAPQESEMMFHLATAGAQVRDALHGTEEQAHEMARRVQGTIDEARQALTWIHVGASMPLREAIPAALRDRYISPGGTLLVTLHPRENVWEFAPMERFVEAVRAVKPDATGVPMTQYESLLEMRRAFVMAALLALAAVFVLILIDLRRLCEALLAIAPLLVGMAWMVEAMGALGVAFNLANFFAVPILIGIGVDSGIHLIRRYREQQMQGREALDLGSTRRAVVVTSMTTMIGFGSLLTASHRGLASLGLLMLLGSAAGLVASLVVLPALLAWRHGRAARR